MDCIVDGCDRPLKNKMRSLCSLHYNRWLDYSDPNIIPPSAPRDQTLEERLRWFGWEVRESGCWDWSGRLNNDGYGILKYHQKGLRAYRVAYGLWVGPIEVGKSILHSCDNRLCINPEHLRMGTQKENVQDMMDRGRQRPGRKLNDPVVKAIKMLYRTNEYTQAEIEEAFNIGAGQVSRIMNKKIWKWIE